MSWNTLLGEVTLPRYVIIIIHILTAWRWACLAGPGGALRARHAALAGRLELRARAAHEVQPEGAGEASRGAEQVQRVPPGVGPGGQESRFGGESR